MHTPLGRWMLVATITTLGNIAAGAEATISYVQQDHASGISAATVVQDSALGHTALILPLDADGQLVGPSDLAAQATQTLDNLEAALAAGGSELKGLVRLHVYVTQADAIPTVQQLVTKRLGAAYPAATYVVAQPPHPQALIAMDAVAVAPPADKQQVTHAQAAALDTSLGKTHVSVLPLGRTVYVSGQVEQGDDLKQATANTLGSLLKSLEHLGLDRSHVVQIKCFAKPIDQATQANAAIAEFFGDADQPATVWVQWFGGAPTEIELIAWAPADQAAAPAKPNLQSHTPPHMGASPVFSRMIEIDNRRVIYISGLYAPQFDTPGDEVRKLFDRLQQVLTATGSDMRHLAKATYYVRGDIGSQYGEYRPKVYDAKRPPAASMVALENIGRDDRHTVMDMIAVPVD